MKFLILIHLIFLSLITPRTYAGNSCSEIFNQHIPASNLKKIESLFLIDFVDYLKTKNRVDYSDLDKIRIRIHQTVLSISSDAILKSQIPALQIELDQLLVKRALLIRPKNDSFYQFLKSTKQLLELIEADTNTWFRFLTEKDVLFDNNFNSYSTAAFLLEQLLFSDKEVLLIKLGELYSQKKIRTIPHAIHILLNPKKIYSNLKKNKYTDREFYNYYLELIKKYAFKLNSSIGGYSGDFAIESAMIMQKYLLSQPKAKALNFFGSVPNGFAKKKSDYDVFNHFKSNSRSENDSQKMRYQVSDPNLEKMLQESTQGTNWKWHLENSEETAHEHFGSQNHIFSFHITQEKIILRFYYNYIRVDANGSSLNAWDYIELNVI